MSQSVSPMNTVSSPGMCLHQPGAQLVGAFNVAFAHLVSATSTVNYSSQDHFCGMLDYLGNLFAAKSYPVGGKLEVAAKTLGGRLFPYPGGIGLKSPQDRLVYAKALQNAIHQLLDVLDSVDNRKLVVDQSGSNSFSDQLVNYITKNAAMPDGIDDTLSYKLVGLKAAVEALNQGFVPAPVAPSVAPPVAPPVATLAAAPVAAAPEAPVAAATVAAAQAPAPAQAPAARAAVSDPIPQLDTILSGSNSMKFIHALHAAEDAHPHGNLLTTEQRTAIHSKVSFELNSSSSSINGRRFWEAYCKASKAVTGQ